MEYRNTSHKIKTHELDFIKSKNFTIKIIKRQDTEWLNTFSRYTFKKDLNPEYMKNSLKSSRHLTKEEVRRANKHVKEAYIINQRYAL